MAYDYSDDNYNNQNKNKNNNNDNGYEIDAIPRNKQENGDRKNVSITPKKKSIPYPKSVIFIIGNEFCERFSYYGMRTILILYFMNRLNYQEDIATMAFHIFAMACYFTPLAGAILADSLLGKYWTILTISCIYVAGSAVIALSSIGGSNLFSILGLTLIAIGTGGIKPCVAAFGGDQFIRGQEQQLQSFFSFFYIAINSGSLISTFFTPILREDIGCLGRSDCYPLAFGIPAILMFGALALFVIGRFTYGYRVVPPQKGNIIMTVLKCVYRGLAGKFSSSTRKREHWLDHADSHFDSQTILEVKTLMRILFLYIPLPIFWALFDQQSSRWTLQAIRLNGDFGFYTIKPDQIQVINPVLIVGFIPIFENIIYPIFNRVGLNKPLRRMVVGGILASLSFGTCGLLQTFIENELPAPMNNNANHLMIIRNINESINHLDINYTKIDNFTSDSFELNIFENVNRNELSRFDKNLTNGQTLAIYSQPNDAIIFKLDNVLAKPRGSGAQIFTIFDLQNFNNESFTSTDTNDELKIDQIFISDDSHAYGSLKPYEVETKGKTSYIGVGDYRDGHKLGQGAVYIHLIVGNMSDAENLQFTLIKIVEDNKFSVLWQLIQYFLITAAEIMFSVTGLEFSYSQAPKSMKSVIQACWLFNVTLGNLLVAIIADVEMFEKQSYEFYFFGILMLIDIVIFAIQAYFFVPYTGVDSQQYDSEPYDDTGPRSRVWSMVSIEGELPKLNPVILDENENDHQATWTSRASRKSRH